MSLIDKYPYGKAPFALLVIAIVSVGLRVATASRHDERPDHFTGPSGRIE